MNGAVLITGASGNVARMLALHLESLGIAVVRVSRQPHPKHLSWDQALSPGALAGVAAVVHTAWSTVPAHYEDDPEIEWRVDLPLLDRLMRACLVVSPRPQFVFLSSGGAVYGDAGERPSVETDPICPKSWYGRAKVASEEMLQNGSDLPVTILRPGNIYGFDIREGHPQGVIPHVVHAALDQRPFEVWGDGTAVKDYLHYQDFSEAVTGFLTHRLTGIFNVGAGASHTVSAIISTVCAQMGVALETVHRPAPEWDVQRSMLDVSKCREALGWEPRVTLEEGIRRSIESVTQRRSGTVSAP